MADTPSINWLPIKQAYLAERELSLRKVAVKFGVSYIQTKRVASAEEWIEEKKKIWEETDEEMVKTTAASVKDLIERHSTTARYLQGIALKELTKRIENKELEKEAIGFILKLLAVAMEREADLYPKQLAVDIGPQNEILRIMKMIEGADKKESSPDEPQKQEVKNDGTPGELQTPGTGSI